MNVKTIPLTAVCRWDGRGLWSVAGKWIRRLLQATQGVVMRVYTKVTAMQPENKEEIQRTLRRLNQKDLTMDWIRSCPGDAIQKDRDYKKSAVLRQRVKIFMMDHNWCEVPKNIHVEIFSRWLGTWMQNLVENSKVVRWTWKSLKYKYDWSHECVWNWPETAYKMGVEGWE